MLKATWDGRRGGGMDIGPGRCGWGLGLEDAGWDEEGQVEVEVV